MAKQAQPDGGPSLFPWMGALEGSAMENLTRAGEAYTKACVAWQQELARFTTARLQQDGELGRRLLTSGNWWDAIRLQQEWASAVSRDYFEEANRLMHLAQQAGAELAQPVSSETHATARRAAE